MDAIWKAKKIPGLSVGQKEMKMLGKAEIDTFGSVNDVQSKTTRKRSPTNDQLLKKIYGG